MNGTVWGKLCKRCQKIDLSAAWERREDAEQNLDWRCSSCGAQDWSLVRVEQMQG